MTLAGSSGTTSYVNWATGEPNYYRGENSAVMCSTDQQWNDIVSAREDRKAIIEWVPPT